MIENQIRYYRACYQADFRAINLVNFFSAKVEQGIILEEADILEGKLIQYPLPTEWAENAKKELLLHSKEKALYLCTFFISGEMTMAKRKLKVFAPLYLYPARIIEEEEVFYLTIDAENPTVNPAILSGLEKVEPGVIDYLSRNLPKGYIGFEEMDQIEEVFQKVLPELDISLLPKYPEVLSEKQAKVKSKIKGFVVPALGVGIIDKPKSSRGILNELELMAEANKFSGPLQNVLGLKKVRENGQVPSVLSVPAILSNPQKNILRSAFQYELSMAVGPPGTGKSFTIAALAVEYLVKGKSVLIASRNNQAVNVVADKIEKDLGLGNIVVRAGREDYKKLLQQRIQDLLRGIGYQKVGSESLSQLEQKVKELHKQITKDENEVLNRTNKEINRGSLLFKKKSGILSNLRKRWLKYQKEKESPFWDLMFKLEEDLFQLNAFLKEYISLSFQFFLYNALKNARQELRALVRALKAQKGSRKEEIFSIIDFTQILDALPIWVVNTADVNKVLPLKAELFDLVILDEATQCDIASSLPILQRGEKAVIVGDPKQLRHISFLSKNQQLQLIQKYNLGTYDFETLDYRTNSILDLAEINIHQQAQVNFLNEHYRSMPDIISFSNKQFYNEELNIMTACPATLKRKHLFLKKIEGERLKKGYNAEEVEYIIESIQKIIEEKASLPAHFCPSIGVISPFRDQVDYILRQIGYRIPIDMIERHKILVGTPYHFQGEERDLVFLTFALDNESHPSAYQYLERNDVFNVAVTRARSKQEVLISFDSDKLKRNSLLSRYLFGIRSEEMLYQKAKRASKPDFFLKEITESLQEIEDITIHTAYPIAGTEIDIVVVKDGYTYCIDLVGYPGAFEEAIPLERWRMLERVGIETFSLDYSTWYFEKESCEEALKEFILNKR